MKKKERAATSLQKTAIHTIFGRMGYDVDERHAFISRFTDGRTESTRSLTFDEARELIALLGGQRKKESTEEAKHLCKCIYFLSMEISFLNKEYTSDTEDEFRMNCANINRFCRQHTRFHKPLTQMSLDELKEVKNQLEAISRKENE